MLRVYFGKSIIRIRMMLSRLFDSILMMLIIAHIRNDAHQKRRRIVKKKGRKVVNKQVKRFIKGYSKRRFGRKSYWPGLAYYAEMRGEFIEGWIPYDYFRFTILPKVNPSPATYMDFKTFDFQLFGDFAVRPIYLFINGMYYDYTLKWIHPDQVLSHLSEYEDDIVIKEDKSWGGLDVRVLHASLFTPELLDKGSNYVIQPYVKQHSALSEIYPDSVNSLRVNTFLKKDGSVDTIYTWLRFGSDGSRVDNITSGGDYLYISPSGEVEKLVYDVADGTEKTDRHKNTGYLFADFEFPKFKEVLEKCENAHLKFPHARLIAWDVCLDSNGEPKLLEWNLGNPDLGFAEALWGPYWIDDSEF